MTSMAAQRGEDECLMGQELYFFRSLEGGSRHRSGKPLGPLGPRIILMPTCVREMFARCDRPSVPRNGLPPWPRKLRSALGVSL